MSRPDLMNTCEKKWIHKIAQKGGKFIYNAGEQNNQHAKNTSGKTKNNFTEELFQLFLHACQRLRRESGSKCLALEMNWKQKKMLFRITPPWFSHTINNKSAFISSWKLFAAVDVCEIKVAWHSWIIIFGLHFLSITSMDAQFQS